MKFMVLWGGKGRCRIVNLLFSLVVIAAGFRCVAAQAQTGPASAGSQNIQDNSFLVEEAYNQNFGVVQHISTFTRFWNSKDWNYTFTQEWPVPGNERHQLSYSVAAVHVGALPASGVGLGDVFLNYRYQLVGNADAQVAFSPRFSVILPTGDSTLGRGVGSFGVQTSLPLSVVISKKLVSHWNAGATFFPRARDASGDRGATTGYNLGQSFIWLARTRFNLMLETVFASSQNVVAIRRTQWTNSLFMSPGIRWSYNFKHGLQIVPGIAVPIGAGPNAGEKAILLYLSFEHPFRKLPKK